MAGGVLTLVVEFFFGMYKKFSLLASFVGFLFVATLLAVILLTLIPRDWWRKVRFPSIPAWLRPFSFIAAMIVGFLFGWLRW